MATPEDFKVDQIVSRNSWASTTRARIISIDPCASGGIRVQFFHGGEHTYPWSDAHSFTIISPGHLVQPTQVPAAKSEFKVGDLVKHPEWDGTYRVTQTQTSPIVEQIKLEYSTRPGTSVGWWDATLFTRIATRPGEKASDLINEPQFKVGDRVYYNNDPSFKGTICDPEHDFPNAVLWVQWDNYEGPIPVSKHELKYLHPVDILRSTANQGFGSFSLPKSLLNRFTPMSLEDLEGYPNFTETQTMNPIKIENKTFVNGQNVTEMSDHQIVYLIQQQEAELKMLKELEHKPKRIEKLIAEIETGITSLVAVLDERDETKH